MLDALITLGLFAAKVIIIFLLILAVLITFFALMAKAKEKTKGKLTIKNLNQHYDDVSEAILSETLPNKLLKKFMKDKKARSKEKAKNELISSNVYVLNFVGDVSASELTHLTEEINAVLNIATPNDEVVVRVQSPGGMVHKYGLAAAQLMRIRARHIPLTITVDQVAASGGYMMACVGSKILAAPYAIIGSIGVVVQLPNFNRVLKNKDIDFEMHTAGEFKRTITMFGENTAEGREKLQAEIEEIHHLFKDHIVQYRPQLDIQKVSTGEHWLGLQALTLKLVDEIKTSDDYLLERSKSANIYEITFETKKPFLQKLIGGGAKMRDHIIYQ